MNHSLSRPFFFSVSFLVSVLFCWLGIGSSWGGGAFVRPNILIFLADDMGWSDPGCYGSEIRTPALDSLAGEGMLATRCYTVPRCSPSRAALMTGRYPQSVGMGHLDNDLGFPGYRGRLDPDCKTLPEILREQAGYRTYMSGKWHLGSRQGELPWERGFQRYFGLLSGANSYIALDQGRMMAEDGKMLKASDLPGDFYMTDAITRKALDYLDDAARYPQNPFFMYVAYTAPHTPLQARKETIDSYLGSYSGGYEAVRAKRLEKQKKLNIIPKNVVIPTNRELQSVTSREEDMRMAVYAAQITDMDEGIGNILGKLKKLGLDHSTIVIFMSDNGATSENPARTYSPYPGTFWSHAGYGRNWAIVSNTPFDGLKSGTREGGESIPCLVKYPGKVPAGKRFDGMINMIDIAPTLLACVGVSVPSKMDGANLSHFWMAPVKVTDVTPWDPLQSRDLPDRFLCTEHERNKSVHSRDWKLQKKGRASQWLLYHSEDRLESKDVSSDNQDVVNKLSEVYDNWARSNKVDESMKTYWPVKRKEPGEKKK